MQIDDAPCGLETKVLVLMFDLRGMYWLDSMTVVLKSKVNGNPTKVIAVRTTRGDEVPLLQDCACRVAR